MHTYIYTCLHTVHISSNTYMHTFTYIHLHVLRLLLTYIHTFIVPYRTSTYSSIHTYIHTYMHSSLVQFPLLGIAAQASPFDEQDAPDSTPRGSFNALSTMVPLLIMHCTCMYVCMYVCIYETFSLFMYVCMHAFSMYVRSSVYSFI